MTYKYNQILNKLTILFAHNPTKCYRSNNYERFYSVIINDIDCYLSTLGIEFNIIGLSENWGKQHNIDLRNLSGYKHHYFIRSNRRRGE